MAVGVYKHKPLTEKAKIKISKALRGRKKSKEHKLKISIALTGRKRADMAKENNPAWKGESVGYVGIHLWIRKNFGKPETCESCGKSGLKGRQIKRVYEKIY